MWRIGRIATFALIGSALVLGFQASGAHAQGQANAEDLSTEASRARYIAQVKRQVQIYWEVPDELYADASATVQLTQNEKGEITEMDVECKARPKFCSSVVDAIELAAPFRMPTHEASKLDNRVRFTFKPIVLDELNDQ